MVYALLTSLPWAGVLIYVLRAHRVQDRERHEALCAERDEWRELERHLLNRIQAPVAAQRQAEIEIPQVDPDDPPFVGWDNDDEFHEARTKVMDVGS